MGLTLGLDVNGWPGVRLERPIGDFPQQYGLADATGPDQHDRARSSVVVGCDLQCFGGTVEYVVAAGQVGRLLIEPRMVRIGHALGHAAIQAPYSAYSTV